MSNRCNRLIRRLRISLFIAFIFTVSSSLAADLECVGPHKGQKLDKAALSSLLAQHSDKDPINLCGTDLSGLDLSGLNLSYIDLSGADLSKTKLVKTNLSHAKLQRVFFRWADLSGANLWKADLHHAVLQDSQFVEADLRQVDLSEANITFANLTRAKLQGSKLIRANLSDANLQQTQLNWADLSYAVLHSANLTGAFLEHSKLDYAQLRNANLTKANLTAASLINVDLTLSDLSQTNFSRADLNRAIYQPQLGMLPNLIALTTSHNFRTVQFNENYGVPALTELRAAYRAIGVRSMERLITTMIKKHQMQQAWQRGGWGYVESAFNYIFFYITCDYGLSPGRPLRIFLLIIFFLILPYRMALSHPSKYAGITVTWPSKRFHHWHRGIHKDGPLPISCTLKKRHYTKFSKKCHEQIRLLRIAIYFSLLSSFRVGPREALNISTWITRLQKRPYYLKPRGWVRTLAGTQSLISAYLIVLWALTYFGRPFEW